MKITRLSNRHQSEGFAFVPKSSLSKIRNNQLLPLLVSQPFGGEVSLMVTVCKAEISDCPSSHPRCRKDTGFVLLGIAPLPDYCLPSHAPLDLRQLAGIWSIMTLSSGTQKGRHLLVSNKKKNYEIAYPEEFLMMSFHIKRLQCIPNYVSVPCNDLPCGNGAF